MTALTDSARLVDFVVWEMRSGDLPEDVRGAALRLSAGRARPARVRRYTEGPLSIDGFPAGDDEPMVRRRAFPHQIGAVVRDLLDHGSAYVLVQDVDRPKDG